MKDALCSFVIFRLELEILHKKSQYAGVGPRVKKGDWLVEIPGSIKRIVTN
jgi:hypothetical protein